MLIHLAERGLLPDSLIRFGVRRLLARRLRELERASAEGDKGRLDTFADGLRDSPLAVATDAANEQHYEAAVEFFERVLGPRLKYSCCLFPSERTGLAQAEEEMLRLTCERARLADGMSVLELGCGWGSLTLWTAERYPSSQVTAVSNSVRQRRLIERRARDQGLRNVRVITADMLNFAIDEQFDRVLSVEMFEHMRNYHELLRRVAGWLKPDGAAFVHVFCHRDTPYLFDSDGPNNWMGRNFFTGGMMPSEDLLGRCDVDMAVQQQWRVNGLHYWRTCEQWLKNLDRERGAVLARFRQDLPRGEAERRVQMWRMFFMACAELFRFHGGEEWFVAHYLLRRAAEPADTGRAPSLTQSR